MSKVILPEPDPELKQLSRELCALMRKEWVETGFVPFSRFMEMALYEPGLGYYSAGLHKLGASGDFVTSPELGSLFAGCLAKQVEQVGRGLGSYDVLELGAGTGQMAADLLQQIDPQVAPQNYWILERSADLRAQQEQKLSALVPQWRDKVQWLDAPPHSEWRGVLLANEVIDALAVERFRLRQAGDEPDGVDRAGVNEAGVDEADGEQFGVEQTGSAQFGIEQAGVRPADDDSPEIPRFEWCFRPATEPLLSAVRQLPLQPDLHYQSEIQPDLTEWLRAVCGKLEQGAAFFVDYGYPRHEYYSPERQDGTLICHYRHRAHDNVFFWPGLQDITAFVDFTALAEAGEATGLELAGYTSQSLFLLACGLDQLLAERIESATDQGMSLSAEVKQLTLPGMMGERFQVMAFSRNLPLELRGFGLRDLSYRL